MSTVGETTRVVSTQSCKNEDLALYREVKAVKYVIPNRYAGNFDGKASFFINSYQNENIKELFTELGVSQENVSDFKKAHTQVYEALKSKALSIGQAQVDAGNKGIIDVLNDASPLLVIEKNGKVYAVNPLFRDASSSFGLATYQNGQLAIQHNDETVANNYEKVIEQVIGAITKGYQPEVIELEGDTYTSEARYKCESGQFFKAGLWQQSPEPSRIPPSRNVPIDDPRFLFNSPDLSEFKVDNLYIDLAFDRTDSAENDINKMDPKKIIENALAHLNPKGKVYIRVSSYASPGGLRTYELLEGSVGDKISLVSQLQDRLTLIKTQMEASDEGIEAFYDAGAQLISTPFGDETEGSVAQVVYNFTGSDGSIRSDDKDDEKSREYLSTYDPVNLTALRNGKFGQTWDDVSVGRVAKVNHVSVVNIPYLSLSHEKSQPSLLDLEHFNKFKEDFLIYELAVRGESLNGLEDQLRDAYSRAEDQEKDLNKYKVLINVNRAVESDIRWAIQSFNYDRLKQLEAVLKKHGQYGIYKDDFKARYSNTLIGEIEKVVSDASKSKPLKSSVRACLEEADPKNLDRFFYALANPKTEKVALEFYNQLLSGDYESRLKDDAYKLAMYMAQSYARENNFEKSKVWLEKTDKKIPKSQYAEVASQFYLNGNFEAMAFVFENYDYFNDDQTIVPLAEYYRDEQNWALAYKAAATITDTEVKEQQIHYLLRNMLDAGEVDQASQYFAEYPWSGKFKWYGEQLENWLTLSSAWLDHGKPEQALKCWEKVEDLLINKSVTQTTVTDQRLTRSSAQADDYKDTYTVPALEFMAPKLAQMESLDKNQLNQLSLVVDKVVDPAKKAKAYAQMGHYSQNWAQKHFWKKEYHEFIKGLKDKGDFIAFFSAKNAYKAWLDGN